MIIDPPAPTSKPDGYTARWPILDGFFIETDALAAILLDDVLCLGECQGSVNLAVLCNDTFGYSSSDAEPLPEDEIESLWRHWMADKISGPTIWCMKRNGLMPIKEVEQSIRSAGLWDIDAMGLKPNVPAYPPASTPCLPV